MKKKYKITGKFCLLNKLGGIIKKEVYINKITTAENTRIAMNNVLTEMRERFIRKYDEDIELKQVSNVRVRPV